MANYLLDDEDTQRQDVLNDTGMNDAELSSEYLADKKRREEALKAALGFKIPELKKPEVLAEEEYAPKALTAVHDAAPEVADRSEILKQILAQKAANPPALEPGRFATLGNIGGQEIGFDPEMASQALYAAGTRQELPPSFFERGMRERLQDKSLHAALEKKSVAKDTDPTSPANRAAQNLYLSVNPNVNEADVRTLTADQLKDLKNFTDLALPGQKFEEDKRKAAEAEDLKKQQFEEAKRRNLTTEQLKKYGMDQANAEHFSSNIENYDKNIKDLKNTDASLREVYKYLPPDIYENLIKSPTPATDIQVKDFANRQKAVLDRIAKNVPYIGNTVRDLFSSDSPEAVRNRVAMQTAWDTFRNTKMHELYGGALNPNEQARADLMFQDKIFDKPEYMLAAMEMFRSMQAQQLANNEGVLRATTPDAVFARLPELGILTSQDPFYAGFKKSKAPTLTNSNQSMIQRAVSGAAEEAVPEDTGETSKPVAKPPIKTDIPVKEPLHAKPVKFEYSKKANKTRVTYADGTTEILDGLVQ